MSKVRIGQCNLYACELRLNASSWRRNTRLTIIASSNKPMPGMGSGIRSVAVLKKSTADTASLTVCGIGTRVRPANSAFSARENKSKGADRDRQDCDGI